MQSHRYCSNKALGRYVRSVYLVVLTSLEQKRWCCPDPIVTVRCSGCTCPLRPHHPQGGSWSPAGLMGLPRALRKGGKGPPAPSNGHQGPRHHQAAVVVAQEGGCTDTESSWSSLSQLSMASLLCRIEGHEDYAGQAGAGLEERVSA